MQLITNIPRGLVVRIRRSHRRGPGSIPGVGKKSPRFYVLCIPFIFFFNFRVLFCCEHLSYVLSFYLQHGHNFIHFRQSNNSKQINLRWRITSQGSHKLQTRESWCASGISLLDGWAHGITEPLLKLTNQRQNSQNFVGINKSMY